MVAVACFLPGRAKDLSALLVYAKSDCQPVMSTHLSINMDQCGFQPTDFCET